MRHEAALQTSVPREGLQTLTFLRKVNLMKKQLSLVFASLVVAAVGCTQGNPGGPGAVRETKTSPTTGAPTTVNKPITGEADKTFTLSVPTLSTSIEQGETKDVTIGVRRGRNFEEDVNIQLSGLPSGVTTEPANILILKSEQDATIRVHADAAAALGDFTVKVIGHPTQGLDANNEFKLTIKEHK